MLSPCDRALKLFLLGMHCSWLGGENGRDGRVSVSSPRREECSFGGGGWVCGLDLGVVSSLQSLYSE